MKISVKSGRQTIQYSSSGSGKKTVQLSDMVPDLALR